MNKRETQLYSRNFIHTYALTFCYENKTLNTESCFKKDRMTKKKASRKDAFYYINTTYVTFSSYKHLWALHESQNAF